MDHLPDIPPFLDRQLRPDAAGKNTMDECSPAPPADEQDPPHSAVSTSGVGSSVGPGDESQSPAGEGGENTVSDIPQWDGGVDSGSEADGELASILESATFCRHPSLLARYISELIDHAA